MLRAVLLTAAAWLVTGAAQVALALLDARSGAHAVEAVRPPGDGGDLTVPDAAEHLDRARRSFAAARRRSGGVLAAPVRAVPVVGRQVRSFAALAGSAQELTGIAAAAAQEAGDLLGPRRPAPERRATQLRELAGLASRTDDALARVAIERPRGVLAPLAERSAALQRELGQARAALARAERAAATVADFLAGPRRYLLLAANNAEMRAGSGMFLSAGTLSTADGTLTLSSMVPTGELLLDDEGVPLERDVARHWSWMRPGREWRNLATSPRFDAVAPMAAEMWARRTGEQVDGVLALDVAALQALLAATGPVEVGDRVVSEETVVGYLLEGQYTGLDFSPGQQAARREQLGQISAAVLRAVQDGSYDAARLAARLAFAARGRHVLAWSTDPREQAGWEAAGISGKMAPNSVALSVLNRGGNKLDPHLAVQGQLAFLVTHDSTEVVLRATLRNRAPEGLGVYAAGPHPDSGARAGEYLGILVVNVPGDAHDIVVDGVPSLLASGPDGPTSMVAARVLLGRGEERTVTVRFRLPSPRGSVLVTPSARVPPIVWRDGTAEWRDDAARLVTWRPGAQAA
ncbi:MAG TPA: DUF4012 domain-containing protein [Acidimicrobiales bacterium]|nr:DUF4012 domain-containing protein [Acidimicrobiales bacterium]